MIASTARLEQTPGSVWAHEHAVPGRLRACGGHFHRRAARFPWSLACTSQCALSSHYEVERTENVISSSGEPGSPAATYRVMAGTVQACPSLAPRPPQD